LNHQGAIEIAADAHRGQTDKAGAAYLLHPLRVLVSLETDDQRIFGVLHYVVEDGPGWTFERL
jgi:(p)ppGpp synthase/HD superfamily hydrolase